MNATKTYEDSAPSEFELLLNRQLDGRLSPADERRLAQLMTQQPQPGLVDHMHRTEGRLRAAFADAFAQPRTVAVACKTNIASAQQVAVVERSTIGGQPRLDGWAGWLRIGRLAAVVGLAAGLGMAGMAFVQRMTTLPISPSAALAPTPAQRPDDAGSKPGMDGRALADQTQSGDSLPSNRTVASGDDGADRFARLQRHMAAAATLPGVVPVVHDSGDPAGFAPRALLSPGQIRQLNRHMIAVEMDAGIVVIEYGQTAKLGLADDSSY